MMVLRSTIVALALACLVSGCGLLNFGNPLGTDAGMAEAKAPYKETIDKKPCPGETVDRKCDDYVACAPNKCDSKYKECLGNDYKNGNFGGPCKPLMECGKACTDGGKSVCDSSACTCAPDQACQDCMTSLATCVVNQCITELYACAGLPPPGVKCSQLTACCNSLTGEDKTNCESAASTARLGGEMVCSSTLQTYTSSGKCNSNIGGTDAGTLDGPVPTTCSTQGGVATIINFKNTTSDKSYFNYWVDFDCKEKKYNEILPNDTVRQSTFAGHPWRIRDDAAHFIKEVPGNPDGTQTTVNVP